MIRATPALLLALLLPLACASPRAPTEMRAMLAASTDLGEVAHTAMRLIHEEGDAGRAEVQRHFDELPFVGIDPRAGLVFVYDVEARKLHRLQTTRTGIRQVSEFPLIQPDENFTPARIVIEQAPGGALVYALDAADRHSRLCVLFQIFSGGESGLTIAFGGDDDGLTKARRFRPTTLEHANDLALARMAAQHAERDAPTNPTPPTP